VYRLNQTLRVSGCSCQKRAKLLEVPVALHDLPRHRAVHDDALPGDVLEDAIVGGRRAPDVVLGRQPIDRHHDGQSAGCSPTRSGWAARRW
jgi:hypothetical protein